MTAVSIFEAKTNLSRYVSFLINRQEKDIIILKNGKPVAKLIPFEQPSGKRIGLGKELLPAFPSLEDFNGIDLEADFSADGRL